MKISVVLAALLATGAIAQAQQDTTRIPGDTVLERARQLVAAGRDADGRRLLDSVLAANTPEARIYAEALYTRGALAATAAEAERDYRRLLIETPLAPRAEDAMLQLANLLQARGDRRGASDYLQRFMLTYASSPSRPRVAVSLVRLLFDQGPQQQARACEALRLGREAVPPENLELRNQLDFYAPRCTMDVAVAPAGDTTRPTPTPGGDTARPGTAPPATPSPAPSTTAPAGRSYYSVQLAAYDSEDSAQRMARLLVDRGLEARVDGTARPFRVRVGKYATRADAVKAMGILRSQGHSGFVTLVQER